MANLLVVEDSPSMAHMYREFLTGQPYDISVAPSLEQAKVMLAQSEPDLLLLDVKLPDGDGLSLLQGNEASDVDYQTVVMTAHGSVNLAVDAMRQGAFEFLVKPFSQQRLLGALRSALSARVPRAQVEAFQKNNQQPYAGIVGSSHALRSIYEIVEAAAPTDATVFITGETGTGKELVAESIHAQSRRHKQNFVVLNCAAIPKDLMESEIFGHVKGAFTGASESRDGAARLAHKGTLFLDEIGEMDVTLQGKLLRFLQSGTFNRVGSNKTEKVDVRIICATNRNPWAEVKKGTFREDLYYRINVIPVALPPLRKRGQDIIELASFYLKRYSQETGKQFASFSKGVVDTFLHYGWPGNVRQLQNVIRNIVILNNGDVVEESMLPPLETSEFLGETDSDAWRPSAADQLPWGGSNRSSVTPNDDHARSSLISPMSSGIVPMWQVEQMMIEAALLQCDGNVNKAAALLEISPSSVYRKRLPSP